MGRIATVELTHKKSGAKLIVNKGDEGQHPDYKVSEERSKEDQVASDAAAAATEPEAEGSEAEAPAEPPKDWTKMSWPEARQFIKKLTGKTPRSKAEASKLMNE